MIIIMMLNRMKVFAATKSLNSNYLIYYPRTVSISGKSSHYSRVTRIIYIWVHNVIIDI